MQAEPDQVRHDEEAGPDQVAARDGAEADQVSERDGNEESRLRMPKLKKWTENAELEEILAGNAPPGSLKCPP